MTAGPSEFLSQKDALSVVRGFYNRVMKNSPYDSDATRKIYDRVLQERASALIQDGTLTEATADALSKEIGQFAFTTAEALKRGKIPLDSPTAAHFISERLDKIKGGEPLPILNDETMEQAVEELRKKIDIPYAEVVETTANKPAAGGNILAQGNAKLKAFAQDHSWVTLGVSTGVATGGFYALYDAVARDERKDKTTGETVKRGLAPRAIQGTLGALAAAVGTTGIVHSVAALRAR